MKNTNPKLYIIDPDSKMQEFLRSLAEPLLHASIYIDDVMEELENYKQEQTEEEPKEMPEEAFLVICLGPNQSPRLDYYDLDTFTKWIKNAEIAQEVSSGLFMAYLREEMLPAEDGHHHLIGSAILFDCDEDGNVTPVTYADYNAAKAFWSEGRESMELLNATFPSIKVHLAGDSIT